MGSPDKSEKRVAVVAACSAAEMLRRRYMGQSAQLCVELPSRISQAAAAAADAAATNTARVRAAKAKAAKAQAKRTIVCRTCKTEKPRSKYRPGADGQFRPCRMNCIKCIDEGRVSKGGRP